MYGVFSSCGLDMSPQEAGHAGAEAVRCFLESREFPKVPGVPGTGMENAELTGAAVKHEMIEGSRDANRGFVSGSCVLEPHRAAVEASRCLGCGYRAVDPARCMGCGVCVTVCPSGAVTMRSIEPVVSPVPPAGEPVAETGEPHEEQDRFAGPSAPADPQVQPLHEDAHGAQTREEIQSQEKYEENTADASVPEELVPETVQPEGLERPGEAEEPEGEPIAEADVTADADEIAVGAGAADVAGASGSAEQAASVADPAASVAGPAAESVTDEEEEADI